MNTVSNISNCSILFRVFQEIPGNEDTDRNDFYLFLTSPSPELDLFLFRQTVVEPIVSPDGVVIINRLLK